MALQAPSGAGKTMSALLLAKGLINDDFTKVAIIDTENGSADLYAHLGQYNVLSLEPPYSPEKYIEAIDICIKAGIEVIIIDSISHTWDFLLEYHSSLPGNSFANWGKITPRLNSFINKILQSNSHFIATMRTKQDYVLNQKDGKLVPEKVGLKSVMRDGTDYEFTLVFDIDIKHFAKASKDRTGLFIDKPEFVINAATGRKLKEWCNSGTNLDDVRVEINACATIEQLRSLYQKYPEWHQFLDSDFSKRKDAILQNKLSNPQNFSKNGTTSSQK
jgi:hypothetical protein